MTERVKEALLAFKLPPSRILPILVYPDSSEITISRYNNFCKIETEIHYKNLLFSITVPIIENNNYTKYELIPLPFANSYPSQELFTIILINHILLYSQQSSTYSLTNELTDCIKIDQYKQICALHHMQNALAGPCEIGLLLEDSTQCQNKRRLQSIHAVSESWHYINNNQWLFVLNEPTYITIRCTNQNLYLQLPHSGILSLQETCTAHSKEYTFFPYHKYTTTSTQFHFIPRFNFTPEDNKNDVITLIKPAIIKNFDSTQLQSIINQQQEEIQDFNNSINKERHTKINIYVYIITSIIIAIIILYLCKNHKKSRYQRQAPPAITFSIDDKRADIRVICRVQKKHYGKTRKNCQKNHIS